MDIRVVATIDLEPSEQFITAAEHGLQEMLVTSLRTPTSDYNRKRGWMFAVGTVVRADGKVGKRQSSFSVDPRSLPSEVRKQLMDSGIMKLVPHS